MLSRLKEVGGDELYRHTHLRIVAVGKTSFNALSYAVDADSQTQARHDAVGKIGKEEGKALQIKRIVGIEVNHRALAHTIDTEDFHYRTE